jgi:DNA recombination protein RmuC
MELGLILAVIVIGFVAMAVLILRRPDGQNAATLVEWLKSMDKRIDYQTQQLLSAQRSIGEMSEIGKSMKDLQMFLASPKLRGGLGEQVLKNLLEEALPRDSFAIQYQFRNGTRVDAVIKTGSGIVPIDSKFPLENFKKMAADRQCEKDFVKDVKDRVGEIAGKYIVTDEGTVDFAIMYVPSESVYYEIVNNNEDLMAFAYKNRVMPVSPSTFYAFLRAVLVSFEGQRIAAEIKTIQQALRAIHQEVGKFEQVFNTLQTHVNNTYATMSRASSQLMSLSNKVEDIGQRDLIAKQS